MADIDQAVGRYLCMCAAGGGDCTQLMSLLLHCSVVDAARDISHRLGSSSHWLML